MSVFRFLIAFFITSIFYSHTITGATIDNILKTIIYKTDQKDYLILHESLYHPQYESYNQGNTQSIGYNTSRITVYDLTNGNILVQKEMGKMDSTEACFVLGCTQEDLWIYSKKYKSGLQSLHPLTLEKKISQAYIYTHIKQDIGRFADPDWNELKHYYALEPIQQKIIVTNHLNEKYLIDVTQFCSEKLNEPIVLNPIIKQNLKSSVRIKNDQWEFEGYDKLTLANSQNTFHKCTFLFGQFIIETNFQRLFRYYLKLQENCELELNRYIKANLTDQELIDKSVIEQQLSISKNNLSVLLGGRKPDDVLLTPQLQSFFVFSKEKDTDASFIQIAKIQLDEKSQPKTEWSIPVPGMFYNISTARNTREFRVFFGDFSPLINEIQFELAENKLIIIYQSQVSCLNTQSGDIEWSFMLK